MILGLILAGGQSSRMGRDKATLMVGERTLLQRTAVVLRTVGADVVAVSGDRPGAIPDRWPRSGPVGGIASAVEVLPDGELLIVPVDMPCLCVDVLAPLLASRMRPAVHWRRHPLPLRMTLDDTARAVLADLVRTPGRACSVAALHERLGATALPLDGVDTRGLLNCNTPDEWREATG